MQSPLNPSQSYHGERRNGYADISGMSDIDCQRGKATVHESPTVNGWVADGSSLTETTNKMPDQNAQHRTNTTEEATPLANIYDSTNTNDSSDAKQDSGQGDEHPLPVIEESDSGEGSQDRHDSIQKAAANTNHSEVQCLSAEDHGSSDRQAHKHEVASGITAPTHNPSVPCPNVETDLHDAAKPQEEHAEVFVQEDISISSSSSDSHNGSLSPLRLRTL
jgi:hypothetical protein